MRENEFKDLLDRQRHKDDVQQYFSSQINALTDMVNYGTWLIPRAYDSSPKRLEDVVVIGIMLKQVVVMTDAVEILVSNGAIHPAFLQGRAAFEASLYIDWILKGQADKKAKYYYVSSLRDERFWSLRIMEGTPEHHKFTNEIQDLAPYADFKSSEIQQIAKNRLSEIDRILNQTSFRSINDEFETLRNKRRREVYWYQPLLKLSSLRRIAKDIERIGEYTYFYARGSRATHVASYRNHVQFTKGGTFVFEPIRNLDEIDTLLKYVMGIIIHTYQSIIKQYRAGELQNLGKKYKQDWRQPFLNIPSVEYKLPRDDDHL